MVEIERQGRTSPSPETSTRVLETTLAEVGVDTSFDNLGLASDRLTLGVTKVGEGTVFVGLLNHPLAGGHFAQFLNSVSPFGSQTVDGIIDDINLPTLAERDYKAGKDRATSGLIRLHERHLQDPRVGPPYKRFAEDHVDAWLKALRVNSGLRVFETLQRIRFVDNLRDFTSQLFLELGEILSNEATAKEGGMYSITAAFFYRQCSPLFLGNNFHMSKSQYDGLPLKRRIELLNTFLKQLTDEEKEKFSIRHFNSMGQIIADLESHRIMKDNVGQSEEVKVKFDSNDRDVVVSNNTGTKVVISPTAQNNERFSWRVKEYQFSRNYIRYSLYPVIAWRKGEDGKREFLTQKEAMPYVAGLGLPEGEKGDVKLGEIAVAYFARNIIKDWPAQMTLKPLGGAKNRMVEQPMGGAQMPGWVAVEEHKAQLLKSETSVLAIIEGRLGLTA